jgi:phosphoribosylanthranilate isomerase
MSVEVKICGLSTPTTLTAAIFGGARYVGFVFYPGSPRFIPPERAAALAVMVPSSIMRVGLIVDPRDADLATLLARVPLDMIQLHGDERPERVNEVRQRFGLPVIKAVSVKESDDLHRAEAYVGVADRLLFDAKPPPGMLRPGGNAITFDWRLVKGFTCRIPWFLAGGLHVVNLAVAVRESGATAVDISSGVETAPGVKSAERIRNFLKAARAIDTEGAAHDRR